MAAGKAYKCVYNACDAVTFIVVCCTLIMSIICTLNTNKTWINRQLWSYSFPLNHWDRDIPAGKAVSIGFDGTVSLGGGITINREAFSTPHDEMYGLVVTGLNDFIAIAAYDGKIKAIPVHREGYVDDEAEYDLPLTQAEHIRYVDGIVTLSNTTVAVIGSNEIITCKVDYSLEAGHMSFHFSFGRPFHYVDGLYRFPHVDVMDSNHLCFTYEGGDRNLYTFVATVYGDGDRAYLQGTPHVMYSPRYGYHGIAGMNSNNYIIVASGPLNNGTEPTGYGNIRACLVNFDGTSVKVNEWVVLRFTDTLDFFALDNFDDRFAVMVYYDYYRSNSLVSQLIEFDNKANTVKFISRTTIRKVSGAVNLERVSMKMLSRSRFGVFYDNVASANSQALSYTACELTSSFEIVPLDNSYPIITARHQPWSYVHYDIAALNYQDFILVESFGTNNRHFYQITTGHQKSRAFGIVTKSVFGQAAIQFGGIYTGYKNQFKPGYTYYTNANGDLIRGKPFGWNNQDFGNFYVFDYETDTVMSTINMIGYAVTDDQLMVNYY
ncbi:hypothetical protein WA158_005512 [Blastocystis sp. Blastoise]